MTIEYLQDGTLSSVLGAISICFWMCAQCPQVIANYRHKHVDGMSRGFLASWFLGDITALVGCLMTGQLLFQTLLASYYILMDVILALQYYVYSGSGPEELLGIDPNEELSLDNSNRRDSMKSQQKRRLISSIPLLSLLGTSEAAAIGGRVAQTGFYATSIPAGLVISYFSGTMYLLSRIPQIIHNSKLRSCGLSVALVACALIGNLTYSLSILTSPEASGPDRSEFLSTEAPFIIGSAGTMLLDLIILAQFFWYRRPAPDVFMDDCARLRAAVNRPRADQATKLLLSHQSIYSDIEFS